MFALFKNRQVAYGMAAVGVFFMAQFTLFTYVRPFLETVTRMDVTTLSMTLLVIGVAGLIGTMLISVFLERTLYGTLTVIPILMTVIALVLIPVGSRLAPVVLLLGLWGLLATSAPVGWWSWVARALPKTAEAGGGLMVAVIQFAIALGSTMGGLLFDGSGYQSTFVASGALLLLAALLTVLTARANTASRR
jgi:predicted MFS family arabinose efflux permease